MPKKKREVSESDLLSYAKYLQVGVLLQYSNQIQLRYKQLTFTWFLATFIGVGYSLSTLEVNLPFHPFLIAPVLCIASLCVIGIIWYLDIIVQEKTIATAVHQGLSLEEKNSWLPQAYHNVVQMQYLYGYVSMKSVFYLGCATILILTSGFSIAAYLYLQHSKFWWICVSATIFGILILFLLSSWMTRRSDPYKVLSKFKGKNASR